MTVDTTKPTAEVEAGAPASEETKPESVTTTPEVPSEGASFYKTKSEQLEKELEQARFKLNQDRLEKKEEKEKETPTLSAEEIAQNVRKELKEEEDKKFRKSLESKITDAEERANVEYYLDNVIKPSGDNEVDLANAIELANAKKNKVINSEVKVAKGAKPITDVVQGTPPKDGEEELSAKDKSFIEAIDAFK